MKNNALVLLTLHGDHGFESPRSYGITSITRHKHCSVWNLKSPESLYKRLKGDVQIEKPVAGMVVFFDSECTGLKGRLWFEYQQGDSEVPSWVGEFSLMWTRDFPTLKFPLISFVGICPSLVDCWEKDHAVMNEIIAHLKKSRGLNVTNINHKSDRKPLYRHPRPTMRAQYPF
ncbi:MAG: hypothetical protein AAB719_01190 [Patescibacteria group bacterium]